MRDDAGVTIDAAAEGPGTAWSPIEIDPAAQPPPFNWHALFSNDRPVELEIGSGKGMFLRVAARAGPEVNYLGVERASRFYRTAVERLMRARLSNVRLMRADGLDVLDRWIARGSIRALHVYFPDPWPKKRHRKRRLFRPEFLDLATRALPPGGEIRLATDHIEYGAVIRELFDGTRDRFAQVDWYPADAERLPTNYALKWQRAGRVLWWGRYRRLPDRVGATLAPRAP